MSKFAEKYYEGLYKMGLTNPVSGYIMPKPYYEGLTIFPICGIRGYKDIRFEGLVCEVWPSEDYGAFK